MALQGDRLDLDVLQLAGPCLLHSYHLLFGVLEATSQLKAP